MSRTNRGTTGTAPPSVTRTRVAPAARTPATRTTRNAVQQSAEVDADTTTPTVVRATRRVRAEGVSETKSAPAGRSATRTKTTVAPRTVTKQPASEATEKSDERNTTSRSATRTRAPIATTTTTSKKAITRTAGTLAIPIIEDALSLTKDFQAILRPTLSAAQASEDASSTPVASRSTEENELDVLGRYLSRALTLADTRGISGKSASKSSTRDTTSENRASGTVKERQTTSDAALANSTDSSNVQSQSPERFSVEIKHEINLAKHVINAGLRTLLSVYHSGYRKPATRSPSGSTPPSKTPTWSDGNVINTVDACWQAFKTIDRLQLQNETSAQRSPSNISDSQNADERVGAEVLENGNTGVTPKGKKNVALEMEKIRVVLISRCWMLGMYEKALEILAESQPRVLNMYEHHSTLSDLRGAEKNEQTLHTKSQTPKVAERSRKVAAAKTSSPQHLLEEWITLLDLPLPTVCEYTDSPMSTTTRTENAHDQRVRMMDSDLKGVLLGRLVAAWISVGGACIAAKNADAFLTYLERNWNTSGNKRLDILSLAIDAPESAIVQHIFQVCVTLNKAELSLPHLRPVVSLQTIKTSILAICAGEDVGGRKALISYEKLWQTLRAVCVRCITGVADENLALRRLDKAIRDVIHSFQQSHTDVAQDKGMAGGEWLAVLELWLDLGRSLNDLGIVEEASRYLQATSSSRINDSATDALEQKMSTLTLGREEACSRISKIVGNFTHLAVLLENSASTAKTLVALQAMPKHLEDFSNTYGMLEGEDYAEAVIKISRAIRNIQYRLEKVTADEASSVNTDAEIWDAALREWLSNLISCISGILVNESTFVVPVKYQTDLTVIGIQAAIDLSKRTLNTRDFRTHPTSLHCLQQAQAIIAKCRSSDDDRVEWSVLLSAAFYNRGVTLYLAELPVPAIPFIEGSVNIAKELLDATKATAGLEPESLPVLAELVIQRSKRLELLAACHIKKGDKMNGLAAYFDCIMAQPTTKIDDITQATITSTPSEAINPSSPIATILNRLASFLQKEALLFNNNWSAVQQHLNHPTLANGYGGVSLEYILDTLAPVSHRTEVSTMMVHICNSLIAVYTPENYPIRRLRVQIRLMEIMVDTGAGDWNFDQAEALLTAGAELDESVRFHLIGKRRISRLMLLLQSSGHDRKLFKYRLQLIAQGHLYITQAVCHARLSNMESKFGAHAQRALSILLVLLPQSSSKVSGNAAAGPGTSKPKRKVQTSSESCPTALDNPVKLDLQLENLYNNLGMFSYGIQRIEVLRLRRGIQRQAPELKGVYYVTTSKLALEYTRLGKHARGSDMFSHIMEAMQKPESRKFLSDNDIGEITLRYALHLVWTGNIEESQVDRILLSNVYEAARQQSQALDEKKGPSTTAKIRSKSSTMSLAATANALLSEIAMLKNDIASATRFGAIAFRLWNAAVENLARVAVKRISSRKPQLITDDPFSAAKSAGDPQDVKALDEQMTKRTMAHQTSGSRLTGHHLAYTWSLLESAVRLAQIHLTKGSAKQADAYGNQAYDLAKELKSSVWIAMTSCMLAAVHIKMNALDRASEHLAEATDILEKENSPESAVCALWLNRLHMKNLREQEAEEAFNSLITIIGNVEKSLLEVGSVASTPIKHTTRTKNVQAATAEDGFALSTIQEQGVEQRARQLRLAGNIAESDKLLEQCLKGQQGLTPSPEHSHLMGYLLMSRVLDHFKTDLFLNSVTESSISMPMGAYCSKEKGSQKPRSIPGMVSVLADAESAFARFLSQRMHTGNVEDVREAVMSSALLKIYQSSLGRNFSNLTYETVELLDSSCALTLSREMLEVIDSKRSGKANELIWPSISLRQSLSARGSRGRNPPSDTVVFSNTWDAVDDLDKEQTALQVQWDRFATLDVNACKTLSEQLPDGWCVVTINLTEDQNTLFISRQQAARDPIVFAVALNRQGKKEEDEEGFTFETAIGELRDIIQSSDDTARNAKHIDTREGRLEWWNTRKALDKRLETLLKEIEFSWLGAFKTILNRVDGRSPASLSTFKASLEKTFRNALSRQDRTKVNQIRLEDAIVECFSTLSSKSDDQELEDLVYYVLDLYLYNGIPVALAELDIEQLVLDVQSALSTFENDRRTESVSPQPEEHIFLILDRHVQEIPWESIPILRGRAISRIPSARFLVDRLVTEEPRAKAEDEIAYKKVIDAGNTSFVLNAAGDLKQTQERFGGWLNDMAKARGWKGIIDRHPTELELGSMLERSELMLFFGHGGMEQYIRSQKIRSLKKCAATMLWGCSSGVLKDMGELDRTGTPYNYVLAGCPSLTAMLWDVTDKDIDKMAEAVMKDLQLMPSPEDEKISTIPRFTGKTRSIAQAVGAARDQCKLRFLTGAAAVTYGIPVCLE
ncbi:hypothetical protein QFC22_004021 [Naganishia vaughanmartiniae]|uniref:Uncharacterized protein n=1 Tax=Naganishia vaughanmartiniae TaxID=1424756 RepID=A0ACC2X260_9TREE|nr:hypothetical protein QFC22_004021 [Naganishia vaughanmartiniae]